MTDFKQIIGRGTRVREDLGKLWFTIIDYTGATNLFYDPAFDGEPVKRTRETLDEDGQVVETEVESESGEVLDTPLEYDDQTPKTAAATGGLPNLDPLHEPRKYYVDGVEVWIMGEQAFELDADGHTLKTVQYTEYAGDTVRRLSPNAEHLRDIWPVAERRAEIIEALAQRGIDLEALAEASHQPDADPLDLLLHVAYNAPLLTRRERAQALQSQRANFFKTFTPAAREILEVLLGKYADYGLKQLTNWSDVLKIPPLSERYSVMEIARIFGGAAEMKAAVEKMQALLYE